MVSIYCSRKFLFSLGSDLNLIKSRSERFQDGTLGLFNGISEQSFVCFFSVSITVKNSDRKCTTSSAAKLSTVSHMEARRWHHSFLNI